MFKDSLYNIRQDSEVDALTLKRYILKHIENTLKTSLYIKVLIAIEEKMILQSLWPSKIMHKLQTQRHLSTITINAQYSAIQLYTGQQGILWYSTVQYSTVQYGTVQYSTVQ